MSSLLTAVLGGSLPGPLAALSPPSALTHPEPWRTCAERSSQALGMPGACRCVSFPGNREVKIDVYLLLELITVPGAAY